MRALNMMIKNLHDSSAKKQDMGTADNSLTALHGIYLATRLYPDNNGGTQHNNGLCRYLAGRMRLGVFSFVEKDQDIADATGALQEIYEQDADGPRSANIFVLQRKEPDRSTVLTGKLCLIEPVDKAMYSAAEQYVSRNDVQIIFYVLRMAQYAWRLKKRFPHVRLVYISHNSEYLNIRADLEQFDRSKKVPGWKHQLKLLRANGFIWAEGKCVRTADKVFSISNQDSENLSGRFHVPAERFLPARPMIRYDCRRAADKWSNEAYGAKLIVVGNMSWYPTASGVAWLIRHVLPSLEQHDPEVKLYVVGGHPSQEILKLAAEDEHITVTGYVDSIDEYYNLCDIAVVPVFEGTGAKIKVLEAMGKHMPAVISEFAAKDYAGIEAASLIAGDKDTFIGSLCRLMDSQEERKRLQECTAEYYRSYMSANEEIDKALEEWAGAADDH